MSETNECQLGQPSVPPFFGGGAGVVCTWWALHFVVPLGRGGSWAGARSLKKGAWPTPGDRGRVSRVRDRLEGGRARQVGSGQWEGGAQRGGLGFRVVGLVPCNGHGVGSARGLASKGLTGPWLGRDGPGTRAIHG